jgi:hypothetical protein
MCCLLLWLLPPRFPATTTSANTLGVTIKCSLFNGSSKFPQSMTDPVPFPFLYLNINWLLISFEIVSGVDIY